MISDHISNDIPPQMRLLYVSGAVKLNFQSYEYGYSHSIALLTLLRVKIFVSS